MECVSHKSEITSAFKKARDLSYQERVNPLWDESFMNEFLDQVNEKRREVVKTTKELDQLIEKLEKLTWLTVLDTPCLQLLSDLISVSKDLHISLLRQFHAMQPILSQGLLENEITVFKNTTDELLDVCLDLELVFFRLPKDQAFIEITKQLSLL